MHSDLCVAHVALEQQWRAADHAVHEEVVLDEVEHLVGHVQGRLDPGLPGAAGHALGGRGGADGSIGTWRWLSGAVG